MDIFLHIAQATQINTPEASIEMSGPETAAALAVLAAFFYMSLLFAIAAYVVGALCLMKIFKKAGAPGWPAWVPVYNNWKLLEIGGQQGFWAILALVPIVNIVSVVMLFIAQYHVGLKLGKSGAFVAWAILFPVVWYIWLAVDKSTWDESASPAPSLHNPVNTPAAIAAQPAMQAQEAAQPEQPAPQTYATPQQAVEQPTTPAAETETPATPQAPEQPEQKEGNNTPQPPAQQQ